ncbi:hypothetical protein J6590_046117 [Homalodisca vitripennis]|nr:hypothetical protein J6590_046117 [Homalodisca vitripennis]
MSLIVYSGRLRLCELHGSQPPSLNSVARWTLTAQARRESKRESDPANVALTKPIVLSTLSPSYLKIKAK